MASKRPRNRAVAAAVAAAVLTGPAVGQPFNPYYDKLPEPAASEVKQWAEFYWSRVDAGGEPDGAAATFAFTDAGMNGHFFNPLRAARPTLEKFNLIDSSLCDGLNSFGVTWTEDAEAQRNEIRKAMVEGKIETSFSSNAPGAVQHWVLIQAALSEPDLEFTFEGDNLVSTNLPLEQVSAEAYQAAMAMGLSQSTQDMMATSIQSSAAWAAWATTNGVPEWKSLITGQLSTAEALAMVVWQQLELDKIEDASADVATAKFGIHGEFAFVVVQVSDAMMPLDPLTGTLAGPFDPNSPVDATGLLAAYPSVFITGSDIKYYTSDGCPGPIMARWRPTAPTPAPAPRVPNPAMPPPSIRPPGGPPTTLVPTRPGWWSDYVCTTVGLLGAMCQCDSYEQEIQAGPPSRIIWVRDRCTLPAAGGCPPLAPPGWNPTMPPGTPGLPPATCVKHWYY